MGEIEEFKCGDRMFAIRNKSVAEVRVLHEAKARPEWVVLQAGSWVPVPADDWGEQDIPHLRGGERVPTAIAERRHLAGRVT